jgi:hypothetical protein
MEDMRKMETKKIEKIKSSRLTPQGIVSMDPNLLVSEDYNVTLPPKIIQEMGLHDGDDIVFIKEDDGRISMRKA